MTHLHSARVCRSSTRTCPLAGVTNMPEQCSDPFPGASVFALTSCPNISAFEGPSRCFLPSSWNLAPFKKQHSTDSYFRETETEWERGTGSDCVSVCVIRSVLVYAARLCSRALLQESGICFLPIKWALKSVTTPERRGSGVPGCYLCGVQSKLGYSVNIKKSIAAHQSASSLSAPMAVAGAQQM